MFIILVVILQTVVLIVIVVNWKIFQPLYPLAFFRCPLFIRQIKHLLYKDYSDLADQESRILL